MHRIIFTFMALLLFTIPAALADTIYLTNGRSIQGTVLKETDDGVLIRSKYITATFKRSEIKSIEKTQDEQAATSQAQRLPRWEKFLDIAVGKKWVKELTPIPATVVDKGVLRYVPYMSFRSGDYELNIYGDPDAPACLEVGIYKELLTSADAKKNCLELMGEVLDPKDRSFLRALSLKKDSKKLAGMTFEVTPESDEDAYGGWWISIYDEKALDKARASSKELQAITIKRDDVKKNQPSSSSPDSLYNYDPANLRYARPASTVPQTPNPTIAVPPVTTDSVYVRGYYKKDGTYVAPHTRSRPSK